jgi:hypothetical protein
VAYDRVQDLVLDALVTITLIYIITEDRRGGTKSTSEDGRLCKPSSLTAIFAHLSTRAIAVKHCQLDMLLIELAMRLVHGANDVSQYGGGAIGRKKEVGREYGALDALEVQEWGRAGGPDRGGQCIHASTIVPTVPTIGTVEHEVGDN